jgi:hypothetical protein
MYIFDKLQILRSRIAVRYLCFALVADNISVLRPLFLLLLLLLFLMLLLSMMLLLLKLFFLLLLLLILLLLLRLLMLIGLSASLCYFVNADAVAVI